MINLIILLLIAFIIFFIGWMVGLRDSSAEFFKKHICQDEEELWGCQGGEWKKVTVKKKRGRPRKNT